MKFLLDTATCIYALKQNESVIRHLLSKAREDAAVSVLTEAELRTGAVKSSSSARTLRLVENFLRPLTIVEFSSADAATYAVVRTRLERAGTPIGPLGTLIAAQAVARKLTLVTNNEREFRRVTAPPCRELDTLTAVPASTAARMSSTDTGNRRPSPSSTAIDRLKMVNLYNSGCFD